MFATDQCAHAHTINTHIHTACILAPEQHTLRVSTQSYSQHTAHMRVRELPTSKVSVVTMLCTHTARDGHLRHCLPFYPVFSCHRNKTCTVVIQRVALEVLRRFYTHCISGLPSGTLIGQYCHFHLHCHFRHL